MVVHLVDTFCHYIDVSSGGFLGIPTQYFLLSHITSIESQHHGLFSFLVMLKFLTLVENDYEMNNSMDGCWINNDIQPQTVNGRNLLVVKLKISF